MIDFITFSNNTGDCKCCIPVPVSELGELIFYMSGISGATFYVASSSGETLNDGYTNNSDWFNWNYNLSSLLACGECFRLKMLNGGHTTYSNILQFLPDEEYTKLFRYMCDTPKFDIPYDGIRYSQIRIPCEFSSWQPTKEESKYKDGTGRTRKLYVEIRKKYTLKTDYITDEWHYYMMLILSHDRVWIDGMEVDEDGSYTVDESNIDNSGCVPLTQAETTVSEQYTVKNMSC